jgi:hypothetical protein
MMRRCVKASEIPDGRHAMTERYQRETARIYSISDRVRFGAGRAAKPVAGPKIAAEPACPTASGSGWYHDAAIRETDPSRKI